jgi:hypothetical protein
MDAGKVANESQTCDFNRRQCACREGCLASHRRMSTSTPLKKLELHDLKADVVRYRGRAAVRIANTGAQDSAYGEGLATVRGTSLQDVLSMSPGRRRSKRGFEVWFTAASSGNATNLRAVSLAGKQRTITNVPGGMWLEDQRNGMELMVTHRQTVGIRGKAPGEKEERELGWFGWSIPRDISRDGRKILFQEEGEGGGPNYTVFLRDTDGAPPARIGEGLAQAISPDGKWVITKPAKGGPLSMVPTGAGESRQLTHDAVSYGAVQWLSAASS